MPWIYLSLALLGAVLPLSQFIPWLIEHGPDVALLLRELFATRLGASFGLDVLISAVVLIIFIRREGSRLAMSVWWVPVAATCLIGVSCGLPLFLYFRERALSAAAGVRPA